MTLAAYASLGKVNEARGTVELVGPFFAGLAEMLSKAFVGLRPAWGEVEARHFAFFLTLPMAIVAFYGLARKMASPAASLGASALFLSQPLVFGHAFINPKDTPFMAFFLVSLFLGMTMIEAEGSEAHSRPWFRRALPLALVAGVALGLTTSIRLVGLFAGVLVIGLALVIRGRRGLPMLAVYAATVPVACYLTWPSLWGDPIGQLAITVRGTLAAVGVPLEHEVLYRGLVYPMKDLPWHFLPFTTLIQLTEPAIAAAIGGLLIGIFGWVRGISRLPMFAIALLWIGAPYALALLSDSATYDNARHFLFTLPAIFLIASVAFDKIRQLVAPSVLVGLVGLACLPGLVGILTLHPYEYIYYNALVGGVRGAYRQYELDYWATSYRRAMESLDLAAPPGARVFVAGPWQAAAPFARADLRLAKGSAGAELEAPSYYLSHGRANFDQRGAPDGPVVFEVRVAGAVLATVRALGGAPWSDSPLAPGPDARDSGASP
jgi:hypothetical protein